jgi:hypothetical protein
MTNEYYPIVTIDRQGDHTNIIVEITCDGINSEVTHEFTWHGDHSELSKMMSDVYGIGIANR